MRTRRILDLIDDPSHSPERRSQAYVYAFLAFISALLKAQADLQHLWFSRRAATRMRSELMAAIYDKALKRKDFSGIVDKDKEKSEKHNDKASALDGKKGKDGSTQNGGAFQSIGMSDFALMLFIKTIKVATGKKNLMRTNRRLVPTLGKWSISCPRIRIWYIALPLHWLLPSLFNFGFVLLALIMFYAGFSSRYRSVLSLWLSI